VCVCCALPHVFLCAVFIVVMCSFSARVMADADGSIESQEALTITTIHTWQYPYLFLPLIC